MLIIKCLHIAQQPVRRCGLTVGDPVKTYIQVLNRYCFHTAPAFPIPVYK